MRIILANRYFSPDESATSRMVTSLAEALALQGHSISVVASRARHDDPDAELPARENIGGIEVHRIRTTRRGRTSLAGRALDYASFHAGAFGWFLTHAHRGDICVVCTDPPMLSCTAAAALAMKGVILINWIMDLYPELAIDANLLPRDGLATRAALFLRDQSLRATRATVVPTRGMARVIEGRGIPSDRIVLLPHWARGDEIRSLSVEQSSLRRCWGLAGRFVVGYSGNLGRAHEFDTMLEAASRLRDDRRIMFLIVGSGFRLPQVEAEVRRRRLSNVILKPLQPRELLSDCLAAADVHLVSLLPEMEPYVVPSKFYGIAAAGRAAFFVGDPEGEIARLIKAGNCGRSFRIGDAEALASAVRRYADDPGLCRSAGSNALALFRRSFTEARGVADWSKLFAGIDTGRSPAVLEQRPADR